MGRCVYYPKFRLRNHGRIEPAYRLRWGPRAPRRRPPFAKLAGYGAVQNVCYRLRMQNLRRRRGNPSQPHWRTPMTRGPFMAKSATEPLAFARRGARQFIVF